MKTNYVLFVVLSFLVLFGWNFAAVKKQRQAGPAAVSAPAQPGAPSEAGAPVTAAPGVRRERPVEKAVGNHHITFNAHGAGVLQWSIPDGKPLPLVLPNPDETDPLSAFPALSFTEVPAENGAAFQAVDPSGVKILQSYQIDGSGFLHTLTLTLQNPGKEALDVPFSLGWGPGIESGDDHVKQATAEPRALALDGKALHKLKPGDVTGPFKWFAVDARYFTAAFLNDGGQPMTLRVEKKDKLFSVRRQERLRLEPGETKTFTQRFYLGPKSYDALASLGLDLERTVNLGMFATFGRWIHRALISLHERIGNFGWAIIILTCFVQLLVSPLTVSSFKHSQKMKTLQPQMKRLQEMYKGDPQRLNQEMLALYQRHGLRFMGLEGCLPALIQMPVFFALYATLSKTFELRHSPWIGWVTDLSVKDPFYVLPVLMGGAMFAQQKIMMNASDPTQKQMMYIMPVMFTFIFLKMPSGLVIYWLTQNLLSLSLQLFLLKRHQAKQAVAL